MGVARGVGVMAGVTAILVGVVALLTSLSYRAWLMESHQGVRALNSCCSEPPQVSFMMAADPHGDIRINNNGQDLFGAAGEDLLKGMKADNIEEYLRFLTTRGHMAGTKQDLEQAEYLKDKWLQFGLDQVHLKPYNVQLSHPDLTKPSKVYLMDESGQVKFTSSILEDPLDRESFDETIPPAFLAFAPAGTVTTDEMVYVNYGRYEDFLELELLGVSAKGRVVIAKLGNIFRGDKVQNAQRFNASAVILYTDPSDYHPEEATGGLPYPHSVWLPGTGIQRGTIMWHDGDPTTHGYPALESAYRIPESKTDTPRIPAHTISYNDARKLLVNMAGPEVPEHWKGRLNITYRLGPKMAREGWTLKLEVNNVKHIVPTYNVIGMIRGSEEPDRYVILGNHRDAWTYGSCDPSSATAIQLELVRTLGQLIHTGWRPRRSIVFASWGAGEYAFFGATEWVEEYLKMLEMRAVAYLNLDMALMDTYNIHIAATPMLHKVIKEATKKVPAPDPSLGYTTLWDHWTSRHRMVSPDLLDWRLGSVSEHAPFYQRVGVASSYMIWSVDYSQYQWSDYPLYHTAYEDFEAMMNYDPEFRYHLSIGNLWGLMAVGLADAKLLPMDPEDETVVLRTMVASLKDDYGPALHQRNITLAHLEAMIEQFEAEARIFNKRVQNLDNITPLQARQLNDQLTMLEKCYIDAQGSPVRPHMKNMMFGTNNFNQYDGWLAPGLRDVLGEATKCQSSCDDHWEAVKQQLAVLTYVINSAVLVLKDIDSF